jgi:hypothetical protein
LFEVIIKNKPNIFFPKSFSDELGGVLSFYVISNNDKTHNCPYLDNRIVLETIGLQCGVFKGVKDNRRPPAQWAATPKTAVHGVAARKA